MLTTGVGVNTWITSPVSGLIFVSTSLYLGTLPASSFPGAVGFNGLPFTSTHTVEGLSDIVGLKICVTFPVSGFVTVPTNS